MKPFIFHVAFNVHKLALFCTGPKLYVNTILHSNQMVNAINASPSPQIVKCNI